MNINKVNMYFESILKQFTENCRRPCAIACQSVKCSSTEEKQLKDKLNNHNIQMIVTEDEYYVFVDGSQIRIIPLHNLEPAKEPESEGESFASLVAYRMDSDLAENFSCVSLDAAKYLEGGVSHPEFENVRNILETKYNLHVAIDREHVHLSVPKKLAVPYSSELPTSLPSIAADFIIREFIRNDRKAISLALVNLFDSAGMQRVAKTIDILRNNGIAAYVKGARLVVAPLQETADVDICELEENIVIRNVKGAMESADQALVEACRAALARVNDLMEHCRYDDSAYNIELETLKRERKAVKKAFKKINKTLEKVRNMEILQ